MIKAIIFDCFGVLVTEAWLPFKKEYFGNKPEQLDVATDIAKKANLGLISHHDFIKEVAKLADIPFDTAWADISRNVPDEELFAYINELKKTYKIGFLSNIAGDYLDRLFTPEQIAVFDVIELSYVSGFVKPEPRAYTNMAKRLEVDVTEAVMVDDLPRNTDGAKQAGMPAILYENVGQFRAELAKML